MASTSSSPSPEESTFSTLPTSLRRRIDQAFDSVNRRHNRKRHKTHHNASGGFVVDSHPSGFIPDHDTTAAGGFLLDDAQVGGGFVVDDSEPGGFILEEDDDTRQPYPSQNSPQPQSHIPLSSIPTALQRLDIQPDDPEILSVFQNAASGWKKGSRSTQGLEEEVVSKDDWRAVCAVLLEGDEAVDVNGESEGGSDADEYRVHDEESDPSSDDEDGEYVVGVSQLKSKSKPKPKLNRKSGRRRATSSDADSDSSNFSRSLTARQSRECRVAFSLFFPDIPDPDLDRQKIMIKDISRVAKVLKEKIKADEIVEMLEVFSTEPDKSMGLRDFERMMIAAKMA